MSGIARNGRKRNFLPCYSWKMLGYDADEIDGLPGDLTESFCGVGNPLSLGCITAGQTVLDLGCGAGLDSILAARRVGRTGTVIGIDMTTEMLDKAKRNAVFAGVENIVLHLGEADELRVEDEAVDVVITNGVFNLCLDKPKVLSELHRVLRPGGRLQMADILIHDDIMPEEVANQGAWSD